LLKPTVAVSVTAINARVRFTKLLKVFIISAPVPDMYGASHRMQAKSVRQWLRGEGSGIFS